MSHRPRLTPVRIATIAVLIGGLLAIPGLGSASAATQQPDSACGQADTAVSSPPAGFDASTATPAELVSYGLPPRPPGPATDAQVAMWTSAMAAAKHHDATPITCPSHGTRTTYNGKWAGYVVPATANSSPGYTGTISEWKVPIVSANAGYAVGDCTYLNGSSGAPTVSVWSGTSSYLGETSIVQAGTDSCSAATPTYHFWNEDYPANIVFEGPAITGGNTAYVETGYEGGSECLFFEENVTLGHYATYTNNNCTAHSEAYADFVIERDNNLSLPKFATFSQSGVYSSNTTNYYLDKQAGTKFVMTSNCLSTGTVLSSPGAVTSSNNFPQVFDHASPVCN